MKGGVGDGSEFGFDRRRQQRLAGSVGAGIGSEGQQAFESGMHGAPDH